MGGRRVPPVHRVNRFGDLLARRTEIEERHAVALERAARKPRPNLPLIEVLADAHDDENDEAGCAVCHL